MILLLYAGLFLVISGGVLSMFFPEDMKSPVLSVISGAGWLSLIISSMIVLISGNILSYDIAMAFPLGIVRLQMDGLSSFFIILISLGSLLCTIYSGGYLKTYRNKKMSLGIHYLFIAIFSSSMVLVVLVQNVIAFLIVWEIMTLSSLFLMIFENGKKEVMIAGLKYLITMHIGVVILVAGFLMLSLKSGSQDFNSFVDVLSADKQYARMMFFIFFAGFGIKAGFFPLHSWLPDAHPAAPSHISALMSGVMINLGIYGILRVALLTGIPSLDMSVFMIVISVITTLYGISFAVFQTDIKKVLAYSSVENMGIIGLGMGIGMLGLSLDNKMISFLGFSGGFLHMMNHSFFKSLLFMGAGSVYSKTHTKNMESLGGLAKSMPVTGVLFLTGSVAICALPPLNGFISEFVIYYGLLNTMMVRSLVLPIISIISVGILSFAGAMALLCFTRMYGTVFSGNPRSDLKIDGEVSLSMIVPQIILGVLIIFFGIFPVIAIKMVSPVVSVFQTANEGYGDIFSILNNVTVIAFVFIALFFIIRIAGKLLAARKTEYYKTWDCGYQKGSGKLQYTGSSFSQILGELLKPFVKIVEIVKNPEGIFPVYAKVKTVIFDNVDFFLINPVTKTLRLLFNLFSWIQSGSTQQYILYGLIFLILGILWVVGFQK